MPVRDLMMQPVTTCHVDDLLSTPAQLMWDRDVGAVPVVDADGRLVGMITDRDICMAALMQGRPPDDIPVRTAMAKQVFACSPDAPIAEAEAIMRDKQVRRVPVIDADGRLVGMLSLNDLAREAVRPTYVRRNCWLRVARGGCPSDERSASSAVFSMVSQRSTLRGHSMATSSPTMCPGV